MTPARRPHLELSAHLATIAVVAVTFIAVWALYLIGFPDDAEPLFSRAALIVATLLGAVYLALLVALERGGLEPHLGRHATWVVYTLLVGLMLAIQFLLAGSYIVWLVAMPLVGNAATGLPRPGSWLVYLMPLAGMFASLYVRFGDWQAAALSALVFSPAIVFVVIFARVAMAAGKAQAEAERLARQLADANRQLGDYAVQAEELATIQERNRLAREIHDNLGHYLTVANVQIQAAQALLDKDPARAAAALDKAAGSTQEGLAAVRHSVSSLRESPLGHLTLPEAIARLAEEIQATGLVAEFQLEGEPRPLDPRAELTLYRAAQEGLTNVRKHARASRVDLTLDYREPAAVALTVRDNGIGAAGAGDGAGFGLLGLRERARQLGGRVDVTTQPGQGYSLRVELPAAGELEEDAA